MRLHPADLEIRVDRWVPTRTDDGKRAIYHDGRVGYVSPENWQWMPTAPVDELLTMAVISMPTRAAPSTQGSGK